MDFLLQPHHNSKEISRILADATFGGIIIQSYFKADKFPSKTDSWRLQE